MYSKHGWQGRDLELSEITHYKVDFDHNYSASGDTQATVHNIGNVE